VVGPQEAVSGRLQTRGVAFAASTSSFTVRYRLWALTTTAPTSTLCAATGCNSRTCGAALRSGIQVGREIAESQHEQGVAVRLGKRHFGEAEQRGGAWLVHDLDGCSELLLHDRRHEPGRHVVYAPGAFGTMMVMGLPFWGKSGAAERPGDAPIALIATTHMIPATHTPRLALVPMAFSLS